MEPLDKRAITEEVINLLDKWPRAVKDWPHWDKEARQYLGHCLRLYPKGDERRHFDKFSEVVSLLTARKQNATNSKLFLEHLDTEDIAIGFQIFSRKREGYERCVRARLCEIFKRAFNDAENLKPDNSGETRIGNAIKALEEPVDFADGHFRDLVKHVQLLPEKGRDRPNDVRHLARLWPLAKDLEDILAAPMALRRHDYIDLTFDILYFSDEIDEYRDVVMARLADSCVSHCKEMSVFWTLQYSGSTDRDMVTDFRNLADKLFTSSGHGAASKKTLVGNLSDFQRHMLISLRKISEDMKQPFDHVWIANILYAIFDGDKIRQGSLIAVRDMIGNPVIDLQRLKEALFRMAESSDVKAEASNYFFEAMRDLMLSDNADTGQCVEKMPDEARRLINKCKEFYDQDKVDSLAAALLQSVDKDPDPAARHGRYIEKALWLASLYGEKEVCREAAWTMSRYYVLQGKTEDKNYYLIHTKIVLRLLQSVNYSRDEADRLTRDIQSFYQTDSLRCAAPSAFGSDGADIEEKVKENAAICRRVIKLL
ncbi:MAG: hypothetical protein Q8N91_04360 [Candidatus Omnitrophota bacterium]|nr:hypothetical protein [Candidatus Omnitrophota bacterium]